MAQRQLMLTLSGCALGARLVVQDLSHRFSKQIPALASLREGEPGFAPAATVLAILGFCNQVTGAGGIPRPLRFALAPLCAFEGLLRRIVRKRLREEAGDKTF